MEAVVDAVRTPSFDEGVRVIPPAQSRPGQRGSPATSVSDQGEFCIRGRSLCGHISSGERPASPDELDESQVGCVAQTGWNPLE